MDMALERIAFLPFGLIVDKWRWDVFANRVDPDQWNAHYWNYREKYQKLKSPMPRTQEDFDIGSKYHIPGDSQYMSYFFAHILEFQLHKALCKFSNNYDKHLMPLHKCDIYKSKAAGDRLKQGLKLGSSKNWKYVLQTITGEKELSGEPLLEYFQPLYDWLVQENDRSGNIKHERKTKSAGIAKKTIEHTFFGCCGWAMMKHETESNLGEVLGSETFVGEMLKSKEIITKYVALYEGK
ncbi:PREDICTED: angiotensin-converting enzyme-related protein-like [Nicrophorus vespilloides]|uniref:Angiotensin-converting enzyme n=1 Tax=Nicrophorus vespilloides TaxID=110193 RepID=A0ABM1MW53_NICVS|nr:PREDICTED: angiotensin-converting enzyme-related protein-like [Nicrophorus vespilloides]